MIRFFALSCFFSSILIPSSSAQLTAFELSDWQFRQVGATDWQDAIVPGSVQLNLLKSGQLEDPFYRANEEKVQWVSDKDWVFKTQFQVDASTLNQENIQLVFEGLDTYATIHLNGTTIGQTDNFFRIWSFPVKGHLQEGDDHK